MALTKLVYCVRRRPELSHAEFSAYWRERHGPLVRSLWEQGRFPGMVRYVQSHTDLEASAGVRATRGTGEPFDGITEVWFDPARQGGDEGVRQAGAEAGRALLQDEERFIDLAASVVFMTREHVVFDADEQG